MAQDPFRTYHANQALELSELVNMRFARIRYGTTDPRLVRMREPDGPSTDAGRKARQPLVLQRSPNDDSGLVFGFVDLFKRTADIRGYPLLRQQHEQRYGTPLGLSSVEYGRLVDDLRGFLSSHAIDVRLVNASRSPTQTSGATPSSNRAASPVPAVASIPVFPMLLSAAIGFALCYVLFVLEILSV